MKAMELLRLYNEGAINHEQSGLLEDLDFDSIDEYIVAVFGEGTEVFCGNLEKGKTYFYVYCHEDDEPVELNDFGPAMIVNDGYNWDVWLYEIEL